MGILADFLKSENRGATPAKVANPAKVRGSLATLATLAAPEPENQKCERAASTAAAARANAVPAGSDKSDDADGRLTLRNIARDETVIIDLKTGRRWRA